MNKKILMLLPIAAMSLTSCSFLKGLVDKVTDGIVHGGGTSAEGETDQVPPEQTENDISQQEFEQLTEEQQLIHAFNKIKFNLYDHWTYAIESNNYTVINNERYNMTTNSFYDTYKNGLDIETKTKIICQVGIDMFSQRLIESERFVEDGENYFYYQYSGEAHSNDPERFPVSNLIYLDGEYQYKAPYNDTSFNSQYITDGYAALRYYVTNIATNRDSLLEMVHDIMNDGGDLNVTRDQTGCYKITNKANFKPTEPNAATSEFTNELFIKDGFCNKVSRETVDKNASGDVVNQSQVVFTMNGDNQFGICYPADYANPLEFENLESDCLTIPGYGYKN